MGATSAYVGKWGETMPVVTEAKIGTGYKVSLKFSDGVAGTVDLSSLAGKGVFSYWNDPKHFADIHIGNTGELQWGDAVDLCPDQLYLEITGKTPEDIFPMLRQKPAHA